MFPEITIKIAMRQEGVHVSQEQSSTSSDDFSVPELSYEHKMEVDQEYVVPSIANEEIDLIEDYSIPPVPNEEDYAELDEEYSLPEVSLLKEEAFEDEFSIPVPEEEEFDEELDEEIEVPNE